jgi:DNA-binding MurR/RpiR family transcriptional regulator
MTATAEKMTAKQEKAVIALLTAPRIEDAAKSAGVSESTLLRWLKLDSFTNAYRDARRAVVTQAIAQIQAAAGEAVETLLSVANDATAPASSRVSAARAILENAFRGIEIEDLAARIDQLSARVDEISEVKK